MLNIENMTQAEKEKLRASTLYEGEILKVRYKGKAANFPKNVDIEVYSCAAKKSGLPFPQPKWISCDYYIKDLDGDRYEIAEKRYGKLKKGFEWVK